MLHEVRSRKRTRIGADALLLNGKRDTPVPYNGTSYSRFLRTALTPVPTATRRLAVRAGCDAVRLIPKSLHPAIRTETLVP